ncbi:ATP-binding protein [Bosea sp. 685]|uniref:PAS domain-containing sensor histidine kinase n=1 Tax=Bosea sp. 685 TaxID=3080057 RepID=UPI00289368F4|nr:ATP-binding protein [Bosea sp. 685]WNJ89260.1 histidine kinase dimerization/phospho-acceptor domain-containing protein [Bosea sp. 685]
MSEAGQDWARLGAAAAQDAGLVSFANGGAVLLWDAEAGRPGFANAGARALLGADALSANLPAPTRQRLALLAGGLAPRDGIRLERLRLTSGFSATMITCGCRLLTGADGGEVLAIAIPANEMRRLGVTVPAAESAHQTSTHQAQDMPTAESAVATVSSAPAPVAAAPVPAAPRRALLRFLWNSDAAGRLTSISPDFAELAGPQAATALPGRNWAQIIGHDLIDRDGGLAQRLASGTTWSGHRVLWRTEVAREGARVELSGAPFLDAARQFAGFRGFGLARLTEREPFPDAAIADTPADEIEPDASEAANAPVEAEPIEAKHIEAKQSPVVAAEPPAAMEPVTVEAPAPPVAEAEAVEEIEAPAAEPTEAEFGSALEADEAALEGEDNEAAAEAPEPVPVAKDGTKTPEAAKTSEAAKIPEDAKAPEDASPAVSEGPALGGNIVPLRNGHLANVRPVLEPSKPNLSSAERNAFREIAKALGARIAGDDETSPRLPPVAPLRLKESGEQPLAPTAEPRDQDAALSRHLAELAPTDLLAPTHAPTEAAVEPGSETARQRQPNSHADVLDKLPIAVLVNRGDEALYANRTLLDLLDYADLADLKAGGNVSRLIKEASRTDGGAMILIDRLNHLISVNAVLSSVSWLGEAATLMAFRNADAGGEVKVLTPEEAEEAELAAEFAAEDEESAARVNALRLDVDARESRISELVAMLDTATDGVVTVDERGRVLSLNKTAEALFGYDQREVTGELFTLLFAAESHAPALDYLEGLKGGGVASVMNDGREVVGRVRQGGKIPLFMTMGQITEGSERRFCAVLRDITAWKKTEGELVEARKAAEKASAQKSDVLAKISHEIRTPLNAIIGFAEVMAEERFGPIGNERYKEYLRDIHQSGGYVISLVNDLLDLAKIEAGKLDLDFVSVNLNEIALSTVALLQPEAQRGRVVLRSGLAPKLPPVVADQRSIRQIVINLLSNAVKFTDAGGQVIVSTALGDQGEAILRVRDTGIGMDDNELALALEPFRQVPTTRRKGGTGLGLPLTKALVEANRAAMSITSVKKEGTLVEITFPPQRVLAG